MRRLLREYISLSVVVELVADSTRLVANADKLGFYACQFLGYQDTLYVKSGKQYYSNSKIEGKSFPCNIYQSHYYILTILRSC